MFIRLNDTRSAKRSPLISALLAERLRHVPDDGRRLVDDIPLSSLSDRRTDGLPVILSLRSRQLLPRHSLRDAVPPVHRWVHSPGGSTAIGDVVR